MANIISIKNLSINFLSKGRLLHAIRNISLDIEEGKTIAIVGESGSGKSVFSKSINNMLEDNGYISNGEIYIKHNGCFLEYSGDSDANEHYLKKKHRILKKFDKKLTKIKDPEIKKQLNNFITMFENNNLIFYSHASLSYVNRLRLISSLKKQIKLVNNKLNMLINSKIQTQTLNLYNKLEAKLQYCLNASKKYKNSYIVNHYKKKISLLQYKIYMLSDIVNTIKDNTKISEVIKKYNDEISEIKHSINLLKWSSVGHRYAIKTFYNIRGKYVSTIFQDPTTSLNPLLSVGYQIAEVIKIHDHNCTWAEAKAEAINLLNKVGIPNANTRYKDLPATYSGGMRQRVVIAIALATKPKILIADEPTTALDVTVQAQILQLINNLKKEYNLTVLFITHDLGVVANIADNIAVMYAGQIVELGTPEDIFYNPHHPYTWALIESLPQMQTKDKNLPYIPGNPPSLLSRITSDAFAPRNKYALDIDFLEEPPMFKISNTHYAKSWLCDKRASKLFKIPANVKNLKTIVKNNRVKL